MAASIALVVTKGLNLGVDFVGGQSIRVTFAQGTTAPLARVREEIVALGYGEPTIQQLGKANQLEVRMKLPDEENAALTEKMNSEIRGTTSGTIPEAEIGQAESVSGKVSKELFRDRHDRARTRDGRHLDLHLDPLRMAVRHRRAVLAGARRDPDDRAVRPNGDEFDLNIVAAILTLIGYSLNDTIVVYDRIRENLKKYRKMTMPELLDLSVNETLSRTVVTSRSVLITLFALLLLGPDVIFGFTAAITLGIFVGTYSSIYMAAPILIWLGVTSDSFVPAETRADAQDRRGARRG